MDFGFLDEEHQEFCANAYKEIKSHMIASLQTARNVGEKLCEAKELLTGPGEFDEILKSLNASPEDACNYMNFAVRFKDWEIEKILVVASAADIFVLSSSPKYAELIKLLANTENLTKEQASRLIKKFRKEAKRKDNHVVYNARRRGGFTPH